MQLRELLDDDGAVSPVIGVILMVAITVILAAVIATFVLGLGDQISSTAPQASFSFDYDESVDGDDSSNVDKVITDNNSPANGELEIIHNGGSEIERQNIRIAASPGKTAVGADSDTSFDTKITAGSSTTVGVDSDATVRVVWESASGGDSATLGKWTGPDA